MLNAQMTTLILAQKRIMTVMPAFDFADRFIHANRGGVVSAILAGLTTLAVVVYLVALFYSFSSGFEIQSSMRLEDDVAEALQAKELALQEKISLLANRQGSILESMERVSTIKYLTARGLAVNNK